jgi:hypothetical protein
MGCCGERRAQWAARPPVGAQEPVTVQEVAAPRAGRTFEYTGRGALTVTGAASGRRYQFTHRGERIEVAADDADAMMAEPDLRVAR